MKLFLKTLLVVCMLSTLSIAANAMNDRVALVTIRFNQQQVVYQNQLYSAVVEAVKVKPSVTFNVVGYAPVNNDSTKAAKLLENTQYYTNKVAADLAKIGVNPQQIRSSVEPSPEVATEEVRIFVE